MRKEYPPQQLHIPVLLDAVFDLLQPKQGERYLDLTAGYGGHASLAKQSIGDSHLMTLVDRDEMAIHNLEKFSLEGSRLIHDNFVSACRLLIDEGQKFDMVLVDLGVSSPQLDIANRGFSFQNDGPLDMRMDSSQTKTAADIVNRMSFDSLVDIIHRYGEEPLGNARRIARQIIHDRPLSTTGELARTVLSTHRGGWKKTHPATRTFQAIRIAVNDELGQLESLLGQIEALLNPGGRVAIISFHSLEDRMVKKWISEAESSGYEATLRSLTKKPILGAINDVHNPRSRSAVLRGAVKI